MYLPLLISSNSSRNFVCERELSDKVIPKDVNDSRWDDDPESTFYFPRSVHKECAPKMNPPVGDDPVHNQCIGIILSSSAKVAVVLLCPV